VIFKEKDIYLHDDITISGHCHLEDSSLLTMRWGSYGINWFFSKVCLTKKWKQKNTKITSCFRLQEVSGGSWKGWNSVSTLPRKYLKATLDQVNH
jgi:hypothetical protein